MTLKIWSRMNKVKLEESRLSKQHWRSTGLAPVQGLSVQAEDKEQNRGILGKQNNRIIRDSQGPSGGCGTVAASLPFWAPRVAFIGSRCLRPTVQPRCSSAGTPLNLKTLSDWTRASETETPPPFQQLLITADLHSNTSGSSKHCV